MTTTAVKPKPPKEGDLKCIIERSENVQLNDGRERRKTFKVEDVEDADLERWVALNRTVSCSIKRLEQGVWTLVQHSSTKARNAVATMKKVQSGGWEAEQIREREEAREKKHGAMDATRELNESILKMVESNSADQKALIDTLTQLLVAAKSGGKK